MIDLKFYIIIICEALIGGGAGDKHLHFYMTNIFKLIQNVD